MGKSFVKRRKKFKKRRGTATPVDNGCHKKEETLNWEGWVPGVATSLSGHRGEKSSEMSKAAQVGGPLR